MAGDVAQRGLVVVDDVDATQEGLHRQAARVAGATGCRQHVVGAGGIVTEAHGGVRADEDRTGVSHAGGNRSCIARPHLEVLGGIRIDDLEAGLDVVDEDDA